MMDIEEFRAVLGWCALINCAMLLLWFLLFITTRSWLYGFAGCWFKLTPEKFDSAQYKMMGFFKILLIVFNLVPYLALRIMFP